jgi:hypothetical protein
MDCHREPERGAGVQTRGAPGDSWIAASRADALSRRRPWFDLMQFALAHAKGHNTIEFRAEYDGILQTRMAFHSKNGLLWR